MKQNTLIRFSWFTILKYYNFDCEKAHKFLIKLINRSFSVKETYLVNKCRQNPDCWLEDPIGFITTVATNNEKCIYLHLATQRQWYNYEYNKDTSLDIFIAQELYSIDSLQYNSLLTINNEKINFKF